MNKKIIVGVILFLCIISAASLGLNVYWYIQMHPGTNASITINNPAVKAMVQHMESVVALPEETPSVVAVTDVNKLQSQPFFQKAQNGDVIFIFEKARRIFLYRPSTRKIIDTVPLVFITPTSQPSLSVSPAPEPPFGTFGNGGSSTDVPPTGTIGQP